MQIVHTQRIRAKFEIPVHYLYSTEKCQVLALKLREDVRHPVDHFGSDPASDVVTLETVADIENRVIF